MKTRLSFAIALLLLTAPPGAHAGLLFLPKAPAQGAPAEPGHAVASGPGYRVRYSTTRAVITEQTVESRTEELLSGPEKGTRLFTGLIPLPEGAPALTAEVWVDGRAVEVQRLDAAAAQVVLFDLGRRTADTRLAAFAGRPLLLLPTVELGRHNRIETLLRLPVAESSGLHDVRLPLPAATFAAGPIARLTVEATLTSTLPLRGLMSPTHEVTIERPGPREARVRVSMDQVAETEDLRLLFAADENALGLRVLTHRPEGAEHGYFLLLGNPTGRHAVPVPKDLVLVLDTSGSMRGEKHAQAQLAAEYVVDHLEPTDRFNVIAFGSEVTPFRPEVVPATPEARTAARGFIEGLLAVGQTNISGALSQAFAGARESGRPRLMLFLTDGTPTVGELDPEKITDTVARAQSQSQSQTQSQSPSDDRRNTRIFALGVGHDVNAHLLDRLARDTGGLSAYVEPEEDLDVRVAALYDSLSHPVLTAVHFNSGGLKVDRMLPSVPATLFQGQEVLLAGRYSGGGTHTLTLSGLSGGEPRDFSVTADFPKHARPADGFIGWLWASRRIGALLAEIRLVGQTAERVAEVVSLSQAFGIVTEYTAFLGASERAYTTAEANEEASRLMGVANAQTSGRWAVKQSFNEAKLRSRKVSSTNENTWEDQQGAVQKADKVRTLDGKAYYKRNGRWEESGSKARQTRRVKKFSPEYFDLVEKNKDFARAQSLDADTTLDVGETRVEVY